MRGIIIIITFTIIIITTVSIREGEGSFQLTQFLLKNLFCLILKTYFVNRSSKTEKKAISSLVNPSKEQMQIIFQIFWQFISVRPNFSKTYCSFTYEKIRSLLWTQNCPIQTIQWQSHTSMGLLWSPNIPFAISTEGFCQKLWAEKIIPCTPNIDDDHVKLWYFFNP